jgi:hypothetical protein
MAGHLVFPSEIHLKRKEKIFQGVFGRRELPLHISVLWKGLYTAVHAMNSSQKYYDSINNKIQKGYQLFMTYRVGYHIQFFSDHFFIQPGTALTHRSIETNQPQRF